MPQIFLPSLFVRPSVIRGSIRFKRKVRKEARRGLRPQPKLSHGSNTDETRIKRPRFSTGANRENRGECRISVSSVISCLIAYRGSATACLTSIFLSTIFLSISRQSSEYSGWLASFHVA